MLNVANKILTLIIKDGLVQEIKDKKREYEFGFRKERWVVDQIFIMSVIQAESSDHKMKT